MTITAFYPIYLRRDIEAALKQYTEELGFELLHTVDDGVAKTYVLGLGGCQQAVCRGHGGNLLPLRTPDE